MKFAVFAFLMVAALSAVSANTDVYGSCDPNKCGAGQVCVCANGQSNCVLYDDCKDVAIVQSAERSWEENGVPFTLYRVHIFNYGHRAINQIAIQTDCTLNPRDQNSVWNIIYNNGYFLLPSYGRGIAPGQEYVFGYIDHGLRAPNLYIRAITYN